MTRHTYLTSPEFDELCDAFGYEDANRCINKLLECRIHPTERHTMTPEFAQELRERYTKDINGSALPDRMKKGLLDYVLQGIEPGGFLQAVLRNDLVGAAERGDNENTGLLYVYAGLLRDLPRACWGSEQRVVSWCAIRGFDGFVEHSQETDL